MCWSINKIRRKKNGRKKIKEKENPCHPKLTFVVGFDFLLELFHLRIAWFLLLLLAPQGQRTEIGFVFRLLLQVLTHQRVLVVIGDSYRQAGRQMDRYRLVDLRHF